MNLTFSTFAEITTALREKKLSAVEITKHFLLRIEKLDPQLNSFITKDPGGAIQQAESLDAKISRGEAIGDLAGVPFGIKDMLCTRNLKTTAGSKMLENFVPPYDATVVHRLRKADAIILGKLNQDEFAMGSSNETSHFGICKNPWNLERTPGGSSGGSAAAQAARLVAGSIGTDTGGSIRQPASFCGVVGVKPTYGRVSRFGVIAYASSLDQAGPLATNVRDAALALTAISGHDPQDGTSAQVPAPNFTKELRPNVRGLKIGLLSEFMAGGLSADVENSVQKAKDVLEKAGAEFVDISIPLTRVSIAAYYLVASSEASSNLARYDGVKYGYRHQFANLGAIDLQEFYSVTRGEGFGPEVKRRIMMGTYCLSSGYFDAFYNKACQVRRMLKAEFNEAFKSCDLILSPVASSPAFKIGERVLDPLQMYLNDVFTVSANLVGAPAISVPFSLSAEGLPIGIQLQGKDFCEQSLLNAALVLEESAPTKGALPYVI